MSTNAIQDNLALNNNSANTTLFRNYIKDNFEYIKSKCIVLTISGRDTSRYRTNTHGLWIGLGLNPTHCMIADYINGIDGDTDINLLNTIYLPESRFIDDLARMINR